MYLMSTIALCRDKREACHTQAGIGPPRENVSGIYIHLFLRVIIIMG